LVELQLRNAKAAEYKYEFCKNNPDYSYLDSCARQLASMRQRRDSILAEFATEQRRCDSVADFLRRHDRVYYQDTLYCELGMLDKDSCWVPLDKIEVEIVEQIRGKNGEYNSLSRKLSPEEQIVGYSLDERKQLLTIFPLKTTDEVKHFEIKIKLKIKEYTKRGKEEEIIIASSPSIRVKKGKLIAREKVRNCIMCYPFYSVINKYYKINGELVKWRSDLFKK